MTGLVLNAVEERILEAYRAEPERLFTTGDLLQIAETHPGAVFRARNKLWRAGLIEVGCRGKSQLKSEDR